MPKFSQLIIVMEGGVTSLSEPHRPGDKVLIPEFIIFDLKLHCHPHYVGSEEVY
jgi:hypothetical protein